MEDCLQATYERVVAKIDAYMEFDREVLRSFLPFRFFGLFRDARKRGVEIKIFGRDIFRQRQDEKFAEFASEYLLKKHQEDPRCEIYCAPYLLDSLSKSLDSVKGEGVSYEQLLKFHQLQEKRISVVSPPVIIPASIAALAGLLNSITDSVKTIFSISTTYLEVAFFVLCVVAILFLLCLTFPTWIVSARNRSRYDFILKVLNYSALRGG